MKLRTALAAQAPRLLAEYDEWRREQDPDRPADPFCECISFELYGRCAHLRAGVTLAQGSTAA